MGGTHLGHNLPDRSGNPTASTWSPSPAGPSLVRPSSEPVRSQHRSRLGRPCDGPAGYELVGRYALATVAPRPRLGWADCDDPFVNSCMVGMCSKFVGSCCEKTSRECWWPK